MKIAVRLDDITPDMDWEGFLRFKALLDRYQVKPLIGVIPQNRDENVKGSGNGRPGDFWAYIRKLQEEGWVVAMHGFEHVYTTQRGGLFPLNHFSEFAGLPYEKQRQMLEDGKKLPVRDGYIILNRGLEAGDKVLLMRVMRGQQFVVLSRIFERRGATANIAAIRNRSDAGRRIPGPAVPDLGGGPGDPPGLSGGFGCEYRF